MALSDIITKINRDAEAEAERIKDEARTESEAIMGRAEKEAEDVARMGQSDAERAASKTRGRLVAVANHEAKFALQAFRVSLIERVFEEAEAVLKKMPSEAYQSFVALRAGTLPEKTGALTVSSERKAETVDALKKAGVDTSDVKESALIGGFVLETKTAVYDHSFRTVAARARNEFSRSVAQSLFSA